MSVKALHNAARWYLRGRLTLINRAWEAYHAARSQHSPADEAAIPGDWETARHLRREVERRTPADFSTEGDLRSWLLWLSEQNEGDARRPIATVGRGDAIRVEYGERDADELAGARRERELFRAYLRALTDADLERVAPLPYRHLLSDSQSARWRAKLAERWDARPREQYWYPLRLEPSPPDVLGLQDLHFYLEVEPTSFRALFYRHGVARVFEFVENQVFEPDYELDVELFVPRPQERFWTSRELDWVVYVSHEHSITFAGSWLVEGIKAIWPAWRERIYTGHDYAASMYEATFRDNRWFEGFGYDVL